MCKRKANMLVESDTEIKNSMSPNIGDVVEDESTNSSTIFSLFLLFGFIINPRKGIQHAYSCNFCSRKFLTPQALGGHQNSHKLERRIKRRTEASNQGVDIPQIDQVINDANQSIVSQQATMTEVDYGSISNGGDDVDHEDKDTQEEKAIKDDLILKL
ncbi:zinc finger protein [Trifolium repens]|nr:zinc finger protein [Trifolium repens]